MSDTYDIAFFRHKSTGCVLAINLSIPNQFGEYPGIKERHEHDREWGMTTRIIMRPFGKKEIRDFYEPISPVTARYASGRVFALAILHWHNELQQAA